MRTEPSKLAAVVENDKIGPEGPKEIRVDERVILRMPHVPAASKEHDVQGRSRNLEWRDIQGTSFCLERTPARFRKKENEDPTLTELSGVARQGNS